MRDATFVIAAALASALGCSSMACTIVSGVDDMELRASGTTTPPPASEAADAGTGSTAPSGGGTPRQTGFAVCGAEGSWTDCDATATLTTCAARCAARGQACVEDCCAYDSVGDYRVRAGLIYAVVPSLECSLVSVSGSGKGGLCNDPTVLAGAAGAQVRCCCR